MAITWVSESASSGVAGADVTVTKPTGLAVNDLMVGIGITTAAQTITPPGNWTVHPDSLSTARPLFYRVADAADVAAANFLFVTSGAATGIVVIAAYRGVDPVTPMAGTAGVISTASTAVTIAAATPSVAATLAQLVVKLNLNTWTPPGTVSPERWDHTISGVGSTAGGHETVAAGSTGTRAWVASTGAAAGLGYAVPIREASQTVSVSGFDVAVEFGTPALRQTVAGTGFDLAVEFGTPTLVPDLLVTPAGFDLAVQFGTPTVIPDQFLNVSGFDLTVEFGTPTLRGTVAPSGFDLPVVFGTPTLVPDQIVTPSGFDLAVSFGTAGIAHVVQPDGLDLLVEFGTPTIIVGSFLPVDGFDLPVQFGAPTVSTELTISGTVFNHETGTAVSGAVVRLFDDNDVKVDQVTSNPDGSFVFYLGFNPTETYYTTATWDDGGVQYTGASDRGCEPS